MAINDIIQGLRGLDKTPSEIRIEMLRMLHSCPNDGIVRSHNNPQEKAALQVLFEIGLADRTPLMGGVFAYSITPNGRRLME